MNVTVDAAGRVVEADIVQPSQSRVLDRRAIAIVHAASPFGQFSQAMRAQADQIVVTSRFRFTREDGLETSLQRAQLNAQAGATWTATPCSATRSRTAARRSSMPSSPRQTGAGRRVRPRAVSARRLRGARVRDFAAERRPAGCNVTVPFKFDAPRLAAHVQRSRRAGAGGQRAALRRRRLGRRQHRRHRAGARHRSTTPTSPIAGARVLLIGAGGAAAGVLGPLIEARRARDRGGQPHRRPGPGAGRAPRRAWPAPALSRCRRRPARLRRAASTSCVNSSASQPARRRAARSPATCCAPGALAVDLMYGPAAAALPALGAARTARSAATASACWWSRRPRRSSSGAACGPHTAPVLQALARAPGGAAHEPACWRTRGRARCAAGCICVACAAGCTSSRASR